jgi:hypothetical protein
LCIFYPEHCDENNNSSSISFLNSQLGGGGIDGGSGGGGSSYSSGSSSARYTTGYQIGDGYVMVEFFSKPTYSFSCTKTVQNLTVPIGYNTISMDITGAAGGSGGNQGTPGYGARVRSYYPVTPGTILYVTVGCQGNGDSTATLNGGFNYGGYNGGGAADGKGTGGGGATDIRIGGLDLSSRVVIAGGGGGYYSGGGCGFHKGGDGGRMGGNGTIPSGCVPGNVPASGGTWTAGGAPGTTNPSSSFISRAGTLGFGGVAGCCNTGGSGAGYYGGIFSDYFVSVIHELNQFALSI